MAIQDDTNATQQGSTGNAGFATAGGTSPAGSQAASSQTPNSGAAVSWFEMPSVGGIVRSGIGEALSKGSKATQETLAEARISTAYKVHMLQIDNQSEQRLKFSSIVLALQHQASGKVAHHTLMLEGSAEAIQSEVQTIANMQVQIDRFSSQAYDKVYADAVDAAMARAFPNAKIMNTGATVVPRTFDWSDREAVRTLINNALTAAATYLEASLDNFMDLNMDVMNKANVGAQMQVSIGWENDQTTDFTGLPVRSDIQIATSAVAQQRNNSGTLNNANDSALISNVSGYMDLTWAPDQAAQQQFGMGVNPNATRKYRARYVITRLENWLRMTPAGQLFALASTVCLAEGTTWMRAFAPRRSLPQGKTIDVRDIGAVNIEANLPLPPNNQPDPSGFGKIIDTKTAGFTDRELGALLSATIQPGLVFSIDVSDAGADTWYNHTFARAAAGDAGANAEILRAANTLTGGAFGKIYGNSSFPAILVTDERVLMGWYTDQNGQRRDLREVDYLWVLNTLGKSNPQHVADWSQSFENTDSPQPIRLQGRKTIIRSVIDAPVYTQLATRCTFHPEFLRCLVQALQAVGTQFKLINSGMSADYMTQRASGQFATAGFGMGQTGLFGAGFSAGGSPVFSRPFTAGSMF
jgi:hypothetical protein